MSATTRNTMVLLLALVVIGIAGAYWQANRYEEPATGVPLVTVEVPELGAQALRGKQAFDASCAECHGENAAGRDGVGPPLVHIIYEPSHHADGSFLVAVANGVRAHHWPFGNMPPVEGVSEQEVVDIIAYVRTLQRANGID